MFTIAVYHVYFQLKNFTEIYRRKIQRPFWYNHLNFILMIFIFWYYLFYCYYCNVNCNFYSYSRKIWNLHSNIVIFVRQWKSITSNFFSNLRIQSRNLRLDFRKLYKRFQDGREDVEDDERPDAPAHQQLMKTWKKWKKWLWTIAESQSEKSLMMFAYRWLMPWNLFECFGYETCGSKIRSKIVKFWTKPAANGSCAGVPKWSQRRCRITETYYNRWRNMSLRIWRRN